MKKGNLFWGLLFIIAAVLIIMNQFGFLMDVSVFDIVVTVILTGIIIHSLRYLNFWGILFPLAFISILYADELNITDFTPWPALVTAFFFSIGLSMIFGNHKFYHHHHHHWHDKDFGSRVINEQDGNIVYCSASFGESMKYVNTENFERADISSSFGNVKVYFDKALIPSGKADIYLDVSFGNAELYIPRTWRIINSVNVTLGNIDEKYRNTDAVSPVVTLHGSVSFGNAEIIYI